MSAKQAAPALRALSSRHYASASSYASGSSSHPSKTRHIRTYPDEAFPKGYTVASTHAGIKKKQGALDLAILVSEGSKTSAAACMTRNAFKAAPVTVTSEILRTSKGRAGGFIINSGCANAVTGAQGLENAWSMSNGVSSQLATTSRSSGSSSSSEDGKGTLVMSTGVIGQQLPINNITSAIPSLVSSLGSGSESWSKLAEAFMTTDTFPKLRTKQFQLNGRTVKMVGIDKGAGMIAPNMGPPQPPHATLLGIIATDAAVEPESLQKALQYAVDGSFNNITVDGDMSTNDTILCFANGQAVDQSGKTVESEISETNDAAAFKVFKDELKSFAEELAQLVVRDAEGGTKFVTINVQGASTARQANAVARTIASSPLVKTAMYGEDANWGRILCAVGYSPEAETQISPSSVSVTFHPPPSSANTTPLRVLANGEPEKNIDEERASEILKEEDIHVVVDLGIGKDEATIWTSDFSHEYVTINGSYRS